MVIVKMLECSWLYQNRRNFPDFCNVMTMWHHLEITDRLYESEFFKVMMSEFWAHY